MNLELQGNRLRNHQFEDVLPKTGNRKLSLIEYKVKKGVTATLGVLENT